MQLGRHLRELWQHRLGLVASVLLACLAALWSVSKVSIAPPGLKPRVLQMGAASTHTLVDSPTSSALDYGVPTRDLQAMTNRGVLIGNIMASPPVRAYIARRARVRPELLQVAGPVTPDFPRPLATSRKRSTGDILKSPNQYRLAIQANPTVPMLDIYAEAPTADEARALANAAVDGMTDYLDDLAAAQRVPAKRRVHLQQLGRATGGVTNRGVSVKLATLTFLLVFVMSSVTVLALTRVRRGWRPEARRGQADTTA